MDSNSKSPLQSLVRDIERSDAGVPTTSDDVAQIDEQLTRVSRGS
jgi:hypothetical protein